MAKTCHHCGAVWDDKRTPGFREECERCAEPLHCCKNCRFYDEKAHQWCREPQARDQRPRDPEPSNTCDFFLFADKQAAAGTSSAAAQERLAKLCGDDPAQAPAEKPAWMNFEKKDSKDIFND